MHCPKCGQRIPRGDKTVCTNCRASLKDGRYNKEQPESNSERKATAKTPNSSLYSFVVIIGAALLLFGFGIVFFFPFPSPSNAIPSTPYEILLVLAIVSAISGIGLMIFYAAHHTSRPSYTSRFGDRASVSVYSAMRSGIALPTWWKWWYSGIPVVILTIVQAEVRFSALAYWSLVLGYSGAWMAYVYFVSKKWVRGKT